MGKMGWIIVVVLLVLLFRDRIGAAVAPGTRPPGYNPLYGPPPGPSYSSSPPTSTSTGWSDIITHAIDAGAAIYNGTRNTGGGSGAVGSGNVGYAD